MNKEVLKKKLTSVGRAVFIKCFPVFESYADERILREDCIEKLMQTYPDKKESGCRVCCNQAKLIFKADMQCGAVAMIVKTGGKLDYQIKPLSKQWHYYKIALNKSF